MKHRIAIAAIATTASRGGVVATTGGNNDGKNHSRHERPTHSQVGQGKGTGQNPANPLPGISAAVQPHEMRTTSWRGPRSR